MPSERHTDGQLTQEEMFNVTLSIPLLVNDFSSESVFQVLFVCKSNKVSLGT